MSTAASLQQKAVDIGKIAIRMTTSSGSGHPSSSLSLAHIVAYLMFSKMRFDPTNPWELAGDRLVLSEGHAVPIAYAAWIALGGVIGKDKASARAATEADIDTLREVDSFYDGHPNPAEGFPFFDAATGSLGMGLSVAAGLGLAARRDGTPRRVYCLIGDGEAREGQVWEAADFIIDHQLTNVCAVFNANAHGQAAAVSDQQSADTLVVKLKAYNFEVVDIDGHDPKQVEQAFAKIDGASKPLAIVARTVKGWGCAPLLTGNWHGKPLPADKLDEAYASLDRQAEQGGGSQLAGPSKPASAALKVERVDPSEAQWPSFNDAMAAGGFGDAIAKGKLGTRKAYGAALLAAGEVLPQVVALDGDVSNSTFANVFAKAHPDRFYECKIGEQNMVSAAAGLSAGGMIPFASTFAKFLSRAFDQIEMANISRANVKLVGSHAGVSLAADGPSQMSLPDVAFFHAFTQVRGDDRENPLMWFFHPSDAVSAYACTQLMTQVTQMCYLRTHRPDIPLLYKPTDTFTLRGLHVLRTGADLALVSAGYMVHVALQVADQLAEQRIRAAVIDAYCLPYEQQRMLDALRASGKRALVIEDNYGGGLTSAVAETAAAAGEIRVSGARCERIPKSAKTPEEALAFVGLSVGAIADQANALLQRP